MKDYSKPVGWCWVYNGIPEDNFFVGEGPNKDVIEIAANLKFPRTALMLYAHPPTTEQTVVVTGLPRSPMYLFPGDTLHVSGIEDYAELIKALRYCREKISYMTLNGEWYSPERAIEMADKALAKWEGK